MSVQNRLLREQNKVRGAISKLNQRGVNARVSAIGSRTAVRRALLEARENLHSPERAQFFDWFEIVSGHQNPALEAAVRADLTSSIITSSNLPFKTELDWIQLSTRPHIDYLTNFRRAASKLSHLFWANDREGVDTQIREFYHDFGSSLWLLNAEIAIRQELDGLEAQKAALQTIIKKYPSGLPAYLAYNASVRNEPQSSYEVFDDEFLFRLDKMKLDPALHTYLVYKVLKKLAPSDGTFSTILRIEQGQSIIDIYETTIDLFQRSLALGYEPLWKAEAVALLESWKAIGDWRIDKLLFGFAGMVAPSLHSENNAKSPTIDVMGMCAAYIEGRTPADECSESPTKFARDLAGEMTAVFARGRSFDDARNRLAKFARNFSFDPHARAIGSAVEFATMSVDNTSSYLGMVALNSEYLSPTDATYVLESASDNARAALLNIVPGDQLETWLGLASPATEPQHDPAAWYLHALRLRTRDEMRALDAVDAVAPHSLTSIQRVLLSNARIQLNLAVGEWSAAVSAIGEEIGISNVAVGIMPVAAAIGDRPWDSLYTARDKVDLALALYARWKQTDDSLTASYLRFAFEEVLIEFGVQLPSEISIETLKSDRRLPFFLFNICVPVLMDTSGFFSSSDELLSERLKILGRLIEAETDENDEYLQEEGLIRTGKLIKSGIEIVDSNRVTVDENALFRWASRKYREAFSRYIALSAAGVGSMAKYEDILEQLNSATDTKGEFFSIPSSEADTILLEILLGLKEQFLENPQYGLEYFLGKRIRHGTVAGHMRGPVEHAHLITERKGPSFPYEPNDKWLTELTFKDGEHRDRASEAFMAFSEEYDKLIAEVRDVFLHVRSKQYPAGLFEIVITAPQFHVLKSILRSDYDFEQLVRIAFQVFWRLLAASLVQTRKFLTTDVRDKVVRLFAELQTSLSSAVLSEEHCHQVSIAIQSVSTEVQRELDIVASWFDRVEEKHGVSTFTLEQAVDIAIFSSLNSLTTFKPTFKRTISGDLSTSSAVLLILWEFLFVVLDNVYRRARVGNEPEIELTCLLDTNQRLLIIRTSNALGDEVDCTEMQKKLDVIRNKIAAGDIQKGAMADKGSGLLKMASVCRELSNAKLDFGVRDERRFVTELELPVYIGNESFSFVMSETE